jgi:hypothetical protein
MMLSNFVNGNNIGVTKLGRRLRFALEPGATVGILAQMRGKKLERNFPIEFGVLSKVDLTHPTGTDLLNDPVMPDYGVVR